MRVAKDDAIKRIENAMRREISDREADILNLIRVAEHLIDFLPCSIGKHGDDWGWAWDELSDTSQEEIVGAASIAKDEIDLLKSKYLFD